MLEEVKLTAKRNKRKKASSTASQKLKADFQRHAKRLANPKVQRRIEEQACEERREELEKFNKTMPPTKEQLDDLIVDLKDAEEPTDDPVVLAAEGKLAEEDRKHRELLQRSWAAARFRFIG